jgi:hypothetical protein
MKSNPSFFNISISGWFWLTTGGIKLKIKNDGIVDHPGLYDRMG